jgi:hypothetical protein
MTEPAGVPPRTVAETAAAPSAKKYTAIDYVFQFITITAGVLIALLINGLVQWNADRALVAQARATIAREIAANKQDLESTLPGIRSDLDKLNAAVTFANEILAKKPSTIRSLTFNINLADLSASGWRTAERTGALAHMDYAEVQRYSRLYDFQDLIAAQQRTLVGQLADVTAILTEDFNPDAPTPGDIEVFRDRVLRLRGLLRLHVDMVQRLAGNYGEALAP